MASAGYPPGVSRRHDARFPPSPVHDPELSPVASEAPSVLAPTRYEPDRVNVRPRSAEPPPNVPLHPIPSMQEAFAESLVEATTGALVNKPPLKTADPKTRRETLLDEDKSAGPPQALWRMRPGQRCHELRKLLAQISFGVYLMLNGMANNNAQVISILQGHIDEVDEFLETTMEDFELADNDLTERIDYLKLPMENMEVFEQMLEDRKFRLQIVEGNEKIEHIVSRTSTALAQSIKDISEGLRSTKQFKTYLAENEKGPWRKNRPDVVEIFEAMRGNTEGWCTAFEELETKSNVLSGLLVRLNTMVGEMDQRAGEVSRRTRFSIQPFSDPIDEPRSPPGSSHTASTQATPPSKVSQAPPRISIHFSSRLSGLLDRPISLSYFGISMEDKDQSRETGEPRIGGEADGEVGGEAQLEEEEGEGEGEGEEEREEEREEEEEGEGEEEREDEEEQEDEDDTFTTIEEERRSREIRDTMVTLPPFRFAPDDSPEPESIPAVPTVPPPSVPPPLEPVVESPEQSQHEGRASPESHSGDDVGPLYILQPRTYTPQPPAPLPSPRIVEPHPPALQRPLAEPTSPSKPRTSLRQRISLKTNPPDSIHVPAPNAAELEPRYRAASRLYPAPDSAYGSDIDRTAVHSYVDPSVNDFSPPSFPKLIPSPHSDQQYFRPVQASPHSPLQQRPHTAGTTFQRAGHQRNAPSAMGMSMLSSVSTLHPGDAERAGTSMAGSTRTLKKKRSAFGWLKKAFSLDEEERAAFEQRKAQQGMSPYYDARNPKFLDGKRIR